MCAVLLAPVGEPVVRLELDPRGGEEIERRRRRELLAAHEPLADLARVRLGEISRRGRAMPSRAGRCARIACSRAPCPGRSSRCTTRRRFGSGARRRARSQASRPASDRRRRGARVRQVLGAQLIAQRDEVEQAEDEGQPVPRCAAVHPRESADQCALENRWSAQCRLRSRRAPVPQLDCPGPSGSARILVKPTARGPSFRPTSRGIARTLHERWRTGPRAAAAIRCAVGSPLTSLRAGADLGADRGQRSTAGRRCHAPREHCRRNPQRGNADVLHEPRTAARSRLRTLDPRAPSTVSEVRVSSIAEHVDAVVVGSGFGASVAAYRLADAGRSVVVLERGRSYPPGSFARNPYEMSHAFWEPKDELFGLFDIRSFRKIESIVSSGLGGGSLIYANVLLRKDERWFVHDSPLPGGGYENWPIGRQRPRSSLRLRRGDDDADAEPLPRSAEIEGAAGGRPGARAAGDRAAARDRRSPPGPAAMPQPKQLIEEPAYGNIHGATRLTCRLCGECDIGCNEGSKNTLDHNYLSAAAFKGADIRTLARGVRASRRWTAAATRSAISQYGTDAEADGKRRREPVTDHLRPALPRRGHVRDDRAPAPQPRRAARARATRSAAASAATAISSRSASTRRRPRIRASCGSSTPRTGRSSPPPSVSPTASTRRARGAGTTCRRPASRTSPTGSSRPRRSRRR